MPPSSIPKRKSLQSRTPSKARHIAAETLSENADLRKALHRLMLDEGIVVSKRSMDAVDVQEKLKMYYDVREPEKATPSHRMLAIAVAKPSPSSTSSSSSSLSLTPPPREALIEVIVAAVDRR